jgi:hypothetical protein
MNRHEAQQLLTEAKLVTDLGDHRTPQEIALSLGLAVLGGPETNVQIEAGPDALTEDRL